MSRGHWAGVIHPHRTDVSASARPQGELIPYASIFRNGYGVLRDFRRSEFNMLAGRSAAASWQNRNADAISARNAVRAFPVHFERFRAHFLPGAYRRTMCVSYKVSPLPNISSICRAGVQNEAFCIGVVKFGVFARTNSSGDFVIPASVLFCGSGHLPAPHRLC